jgi:hypothetical protein
MKSSNICEVFAKKKQILVAGVIEGCANKLDD